MPLTLVPLTPTSVSLSRLTTAAFPAPWPGSSYIDLVGDFGADPLGNSDDSASFTNAFVQAQTTVQGAVVARSIVLRPGVYNVHEIDWNHITSIFGAGEIGSIRIRYNGAGGTGSYMFRNNTAGGSIPFQGFFNIQFEGWHGGVTDPITDMILTYTGPGALVDATGIDWGHKLENCRFRRCFGNAIYAPVQVTNWHMNRLRFDEIGGFCLALSSPSGTGGNAPHPVTLHNCAFGTAADTSFYAAATAQGYFNGTNWCKGVMQMLHCYGYRVMLLGTSRMEFNKSLVTYDGMRQLFYLLNDDGALASLALIQASGTVDPGDAAVLVRDTGSRHDIYLDAESAARGAAKAVLTNTAGTIVHDVPGTRQAGAIFCPATLGSDWFGFQVGDTGIESGSGAPTGAGSRANGSLLFRNNVVPGSTGVGLVVTSPLGGAGLARPSVVALVSDATWTAGSVVVTLPTAELNKVPLNVNVTLVAGGVASADLNTIITAVNPDAHTVTVGTAPSTSSAGATGVINSQALTWSDFGDIASYGSAAPSGGTHNLGEKRWKTNPSVSGTSVLIGWVCTAAGSPGTWTPMYTSTVALP